MISYSSRLWTAARRLLHPGRTSPVPLRNLSTMATLLPAGSEYHDESEADAFFNNLLDLIREQRLVVEGSRDHDVLDFQQPTDLRSKLDLPITPEGTSKDELLSICRKAIQYSVKTDHPYFFNQFYAKVDTYSLAGAFLVDALNTNQHTYEVAPVFVLVERYILSKINSLVGFKEYDGVFVPGGSIGNMMGCHLARFRQDRKMRQTGHFRRDRLVLFCSEEAHYSLRKAAHFMGFGTDSVINVKSDDRGRLDPSDLSHQIMAAREQGNEPFFVVATCGTTVMGAFDPLEAIADICEEHNLWLHVDAAWGGGVLVSDKHRHLMKGVHRANSLLWNFHKMFRTTLQCSAFLVNDGTILEECNGLKAEYLFQPDKGYDVSFDTGDKTIQCGRKADAFKVWLQWKGRGDKGLAYSVDINYHNAQYLTKQLGATAGFKLVWPEFECTNICFWYIPPRLRALPETDEWWQEIRQVTAKVKDNMMRAGTMMIGYQPLHTKNYVNFFRIIINNPDLTEADMDFVISETHRLGHEL